MPYIYHPDRDTYTECNTVEDVLTEHCKSLDNLKALVIKLAVDRVTGFHPPSAQVNELQRLTNESVWFQDEYED